MSLSLIKVHFIYLFDSIADLQGCILIFQGIDEELSLAAEAFLEGEDGCVLNMSKKEVNVL